MEYVVHPKHEKEIDVLVIGGGAAGFSAAVAAARSGAKTMLVEKNAMLGGTVTTGGVAFPGLFHAWGRQIIDGPCWESICRTAALGGAEIPQLQYQPAHHSFMQVPVNVFWYATVLEQMCHEAGVELLFHAMPADARETDDEIRVLLAVKEGTLLVHAKEAIDTTGDANLTALLGYPLLTSSDLQPATLINDITGYDPAATADKEAFQSFLEQEQTAGRLFPEDYQGYSLWNQLQVGRLSMHIDAPEAQTSAGRTALEQAARATLQRIVCALRRYPGLEKLTVQYAAEECGVRETVRIDGELCMQVEDYVAGKRYDDAVCYAFYPVDRHLPTGLHQIFLQPEVVPTIPYRALIPKGSRRLLAAGRCISGDRDTVSATRVVAPCMATGQAAGVAAALALKYDCGVSAVPYDALCDGLERIGAIVPR